MLVKNINRMLRTQKERKDLHIFHFSLLLPRIHFTSVVVNLNVCVDFARYRLYRRSNTFDSNGSHDMREKLFGEKRFFSSLSFGCEMLCERKGMEEGIWNV